VLGASRNASNLATDALRCANTSYVTIAGYLIHDPKAVLVAIELSLMLLSISHINLIPHSLTGADDLSDRSVIKGGAEPLEGVPSQRLGTRERRMGKGYSRGYQSSGDGHAMLCPSY
jgi:hypothetical protein